MKKTFTALSFLLIGNILLFISCAKTGPIGPEGQNGANGLTGPAGPALYGIITGNVIMTNQYGTSVTNAYVNGYILLKNSTTGARIDSVVANGTTGQYTIDSVPSGTYSMYCTYAGYGLNVHQNVQVVGGTLLIDNKISAIPNFNVTTAYDSIGTTKKNNTLLYIAGTIAPDLNGARTILIFAGTTSATSSAPEYYSFLTTKVIPQDSLNYSLTIPIATIFANGFSLGSSVYFAIYGASNNYTYGAYSDYTYGQIVYTAISATSVNPTPNGITLP